MIEPTPLKIELLCKHCGTYLQGEWQKYNTGVEIAVDTWPRCCVQNEGGDAYVSG